MNEKQQIEFLRQNLLAEEIENIRLQNENAELVTTVKVLMGILTI